MVWSYIHQYLYMSMSFFNVPPINPLTPSLPPNLEAVIKIAKLVAKVRLSNLFAPLSRPSRIEAEAGTGNTVASARGATYNAISPRRLGDSSKMDQPQRRQPSRGPVVSSHTMRDFEGKKIGPIRVRARHTPYLQLKDVGEVPCQGDKCRQEGG